MPFEKLYEYQDEDVQKASEVHSFLNGSDMGTGKTHTAIETACVWRQHVIDDHAVKLPILVVCPINVFESWDEKFKEQKPELSTMVINIKKRQPFIDSIAKCEHDVYIMHWDGVRLVIDEFLSRGIMFSVVIGDEIHNIANRNTAKAKAFKKIRTYRRYAASGTASGNKPWNLWSVLNWLYPTKYSSYWAFVGKFALDEYDYVGSGSYRKFIGVKNVEMLHDQMDPFYVKHLKNSQCCEHHPKGVMPYLPPKVYERLYVNLTPTQSRIYNQMSEKLVAWVGDNQDKPMVASTALVKLLRLAQITAATPVVTMEEVRREDPTTNEEYDEIIEHVELALPSPKMDAAFEIIQESDSSIVVFTSFKKVAYLFERYLRDRGVSCEVLSGDTKQHERTLYKERFRAGEFKVFIAVIQAAAEGMDGLQDVASTAIFFDRSTSSIKNIQAEDRLHRGGQEHNVTIVDIIARHTYDSERLDKLDGNWNMIKRMLGI